MLMKSVLIVEDEILVAMDLERILEDAGYRVAAIVADQKEAMSTAGAVDMAFVDINLRDGATGPEIARDLAKRYGARIVYVTANPAQIGEPAENAVGCIRKPFNEAAILAAAALADPDQQDAIGHEDVIRL
ncbi:response regulator [Sphingomonas sp. MAHUQ-71]|uniref:Response regulator n=2 Tax=Sphingomonas oryzagri TaxID=3042314 RepID=A0ABT6N2V7_9SPHN|nr:response regulator [Sphingomonas oryzagri]MDH7639386.1 response regulator [Sphingomonas oryzagri]